MPLRGRKEHRASMRRLTDARIAEVIGAGLYEAADVVRAKAFQSISAGSVSGKGHKASKPGQPPNRDTGDLQTGLKIARTGKRTSRLPHTLHFSRCSTDPICRDQERREQSSINGSGERMTTRLHFRQSTRTR